LKNVPLVVHQKGLAVSSGFTDKRLTRFKVRREEESVGEANVPNCYLSIDASDVNIHPPLATAAITGSVPRRQ